MNLVYKSRIGLIRFAKVFPFLLCFIVLISLSETLFSLLISDFVILDGSLTPNTPLAWLIADKYEFEIYLLVLLKQQTYFPTIELYIEYIYAICIANILICAFFCYKGITIFLKNAK